MPGADTVVKNTENGDQQSDRRQEGVSLVLDSSRDYSAKTCCLTIDSSVKTCLTIDRFQ